MVTLIWKMTVLMLVDFMIERRLAWYQLSSHCHCGRPFFTDVNGHICFSSPLLETIFMPPGCET
jgi:hypothetical protein